MTVKLLRAFDGHDAGMAYSGDAETEADLVRNGNAVEDLRHAEHPAAPDEGAAPVEEVVQAPVEVPLVETPAEDPPQQ